MCSRHEAHEPENAFYSGLIHMGSCKLNVAYIYNGKKYLAYDKLTRNRLIKAIYSLGVKSDSFVTIGCSEGEENGVCHSVIPFRIETF